jgi:hypothetical protein
VRLRRDEKVILRAKRLEKVNLQSGHVVRILDGFMAAPVPHNIVASFKNAGISLMLDDERVLRWRVTPETARSLFGAPFDEPLASMVRAAEEEEEEEVDPNVEGFIQRIVAISSRQGEDGDRSSVSSGRSRADGA